ncbi:MAG: hypothetical protein EXQ89_03685, partial [Rhodospirillaceae bacterium]|nr:hypothetical protein [Rhodospirillaceae bacterium]
MTDALKRDLREAIANGRLVAIVGSGVSVGATGGNAVASWDGLLASGIQRCVSLFGGQLPTGWEAEQARRLKSGDLNSWLDLASEIETRFAGQPGQYGRWLKETVGALQATDRGVIAALHNLGIPLATTNYDGLIETVERPFVTWRNEAQAVQILRGEERGILHLHGYWQEGESVVFGRASYERLTNSAFAQGAQQALTFSHSLMFVGFRGSLADPNFTRLLTWLREVMGNTHHRHYLLCATDRVAVMESAINGCRNLFVLPFGTREELAAFLADLAPRRFVALPPPPERILGRDAALGDLVAALLADKPPPVPILGAPGIGKSTLALAALHDPRVAEKFGRRRYFVRLDGAASGEAMAGAIVTALGLPPSSKPLDAAVAALAEAPAVLMLDNTETPWDQDATGCDTAFGLLAQHAPGLALVATLRGGIRPRGAPWRGAIEVMQLSDSASRSMFLAIAGQKHAGDALLPDILAALDGLPLAIELFAAAAEAEPNLAGLWSEWQHKSTALLQRGAADT